MKWRISRDLLDRIVAETRAGPGLEACGLLLGREGSIQAAIAASNLAGDAARAFEIDPATHVRAARNARTAGLAIIGHYHSHPGGNVRPSPADAARADGQGLLWLILADDRHAAWLSRHNGRIAGAFEPAQLAIDAVPCQSDWFTPIGALGQQVTQGKDEISRIRESALFAAVP